MTEIFALHSASGVQATYATLLTAQFSALISCISLEIVIQFGVPYFFFQFFARKKGAAEKWWDPLAFFLAVQVLHISSD